MGMEHVDIQKYSTTSKNILDAGVQLEYNISLDIHTQKLTYKPERSAAMLLLPFAFYRHYMLMRNAFTINFGVYRFL